jgi:hypothetical protein
METQLELVLKRLNARESAELRAAKRRIADLEQQLAEARQTKISGA